MPEAEVGEVRKCSWWGKGKFYQLYLNAVIMWIHCGDLLWATVPAVHSTVTAAELAKRGNDCRAFSHHYLNHSTKLRNFGGFFLLPFPLGDRLIRTVLPTFS